MGVSRVFLRLAVAGALAGALAGCSEVDVEIPVSRTNAPYVPTPYSTVHKMLDLAKAGPGDVIYDLGSGDGRIPISAVERYGVARATGIEINPELVRISNENAKKAGVADRARFMTADIFKTDFSDATIVTLYLLQDLNIELQPRLLKELKPGTRIVSHRFDLGSWPHDGYASIDENPPLSNLADDDANSLFLWIVPADASGRWLLTAGGETFPLRLSQVFQEVEGTIEAFGRAAKLDEGRLTGERFRFAAEAMRGERRVPLRFDGLVKGRAMTGTLSIDGRDMTATGVPAP